MARKLSWQALGANKTHGLRRTNADKRRAVEAALKMRPGASDRAIAEHCGVAPTTVGTIRSQVSKLDTSPPTRTGLDGKEYPATRQPATPPADIPPPLPFVVQVHDDGPAIHLSAIM